MNGFDSLIRGRLVTTYGVIENGWLGISGGRTSARMAKISIRANFQKNNGVLTATAGQTNHSSRLTMIVAQQSTKPITKLNFSRHARLDDSAPHLLSAPASRQVPADSSSSPSAGVRLAPAKKPAPSAKSTKVLEKL